MSGLGVDTRSDIYSLGVLLYELLTGSTPLIRKRLRDAAYGEILHLIKDEEPPKPSTRLSDSGEALVSISAQRHMEPAKLTKLVRGELDWIVMKALEKDRNRRYETASAFAADVLRYLHDEPVQACPPSPGYRLRKFARKHRTLLRIAGLFVLFLVLAAAASAWQAVRATLAERQALAERDRAEASFRMARDAVDRLYTQVSQSPRLKARGMEKLRKDLLQIAQQFHEKFIHEQFDAPGVRHDLGLAYQRLAEIDRALGEYPAAEESLLKAIATFRELVSEQPGLVEYERDLGASYAALALVYFDKGRMEKAEAAFEQALAIQEKQADAYPEAAEFRYPLAKTYHALGFMHGRLHHVESAAKRYQQALDILSKLVQDYPVYEHQLLLATTQTDLANTYASKGWFDKSELALKEAQRIYGRLMHDHPDSLPEHLQSLARSQAILGMAYRGQDQNEKAEAAQQQALEIFEKVAKEHPDVLEYAYSVGRCYIELGITANSAGRPDDAVTRHEKAIAILEGVLGGGFGAARNALLTARLDRATARAARGEHAQASAEAEALARRGDLNSGHLYDLACAFSQSSAAADRDPKLSPADRARLKEGYAERAMNFLHQAVKEGWLFPNVLKTDPDVKSLRAREDFRKLLAELEAKEKESNKP
jgi:tetratricopeptide (TPR) repeat protein